MWNGSPCKDDYTTEVMTDMGHCIRFNSANVKNTSPLHSERPGK